MVEKKSILIFTADVGFGHRSAANAVAAALNELHNQDCEVEILNVLNDERVPAFLRNSQTDYDRMVREMPDIYRLRYQISDTPVPNAIMESVFTIALFSVLQEIVHTRKPAAVVTTHTMYPAPLGAVLTVNKLDIPLITVVTDLVDLHRLWFNPASDLCLLPTEEARQQALDLGLKESQVQITGIPINPRLANPVRDKTSLRLENGLLPDMTTVLAVGSKRLKNLPEYLNVLNHSGLPLQLVLVAGGDDETYDIFNQTEWHIPHKLNNYVEDMPSLMHAADCVISKAGGLIVTESLACGLPLLLIDVTPGQEMGNAGYVIENGAGEWAQTPIQALEIMAHWLESGGKLLAEYCARASALGRPRAAHDIASLVWSAIVSGNLHSREDRTRLLPALLELLNSFDLGREDERTI
jgi:1,2-diacylglycerol 3-beta-galactosyltransferase